MRAALVALFIILAFASEEISSELKEKQKEGCVRLFKNYTAQLQQEIDQVKKNLSADQQEEFHKRILVKAIKACESLYISLTDVQNFVKTYRQKLDIYSQQIFNLNQLTAINFDQELTEEDRKIVEFAKKILEAKQEEPFMVWGYNLRKLPKSAKYYYLVTYAAIVIFALYHGLKEIEPPKPKRD